MSFYEAFKDAMNMAQKADNIELYRQLLDLSAQALELQAEVSRLTVENKQLKQKADLERRILRNEQPFFTLEGENQDIRYCSNCWAKNKILIQLQCNDDGHFRCSECTTKGIYDKAKRRSLVFM